MRWAQVIACLFVVFGPTSGVNAAPLAGVERLQSPAWLIRDDVRVISTADDPFKRPHGNREAVKKTFKTQPSLVLQRHRRTAHQAQVKLHRGTRRALPSLLPSDTARSAKLK